MRASDLKLFGAVTALAAAGYLAVFHVNWNWVRSSVQRQKPAAGTFSPDGTPGSSSFQAVREENRGRAAGIGAGLP